MHYYFKQYKDVLEDKESSIADRYTECHRIMTEMMNELTGGTGLVFSGPFARFTYLVREHGVDQELYTRLNAFRSMMKHLSEQKEDALREHLPSDVRDMVLFAAKVLECEVPEELSDMLPKEAHRWKNAKRKLSYLRVSVEEWDANYITARTENYEEEVVKIDYACGDNFFGNWSYIGRLLQAGSQINVINPVKMGDVYKAELLIFEPDYLIDISSIASSYQPYGATPYNYLLSKIKPQPKGKAILMGNFAGQLLDEIVHEPEKDNYAESVRRFFSNNALSLVAELDGNNNGFHNEAKSQAQNIRNIINTALNDESNFSLDKVVLEPSFFCEMLGIQGRMDLLTSDFRVLMEQKSGKMADERTKRHIEYHYVQMLLYLALLHYSFNMRNEDVSSYLLYSKYPDGLIAEGPAPKVLFEALRLRNQIVWNEYNLGKGGVRMFDKLTVNAVNVNKLTDSHFEQYQRKEIEVPLNVIHAADTMVKEYFYRMFTFVQREHILSKVGSSHKEVSGLAALWNCTLEEKKLAGSILFNLKIDEAQLAEDAKDEDYEGVSRIVLHQTSTDDDYLPNFRYGDTVILYKYSKGDVPDVRKTIIFKATINDFVDDDVVVTLRAPQKNLQLFEQTDETFWALEPDSMDSAFNSQYRGLYSLLTANERRRDLILGRRMPERDETLCLNGDYGNFNKLVLGAKQAKDYYIVIGPPGTGKTSFGLMNILNETYSDPNTNILLMSFTNRAVDEICSKLVKAKLDFIRVGTDSLCPEEYKPYMMSNKIADIKTVDGIKEYLTGMRIFVGTTASLSGKQDIFTIKSFSLAIIDEASQILEPQIMPLLTAKHGDEDAIKKFVLIGDHKQLPAVVQQSVEESVVKDDILHDIHLFNCRNSFFERMLSFHDADNSPYVFRLTRQGRMHHDVALFASESFYENKLKTVPLVHQECDISFENYEQGGIEELLCTKRFAFIPVAKPAHSPSCKVNHAEAEVIAKIVYATWNLYKKNGREFKTNDSVGVIVPYRNQIAVVRKEISKFGIAELEDITIDTVERYQGSERDVIVYGFTIQREYQLAFLTNNVFEENGYIIDRKLNVALTRAREHNIVVGNPDLLRQNSIFCKLLNF